jgi:hypothetical protein
MSETPQRIIDAHKRCRAIQMKYGHMITPRVSAWFGARWSAALAADPEGFQLRYLLDEFEELIEATVRETKYA